jgi:hypothetical protein
MGTKGKTMTIKTIQNITHNKADRQVADTQEQLWLILMTASEN